MVGQAHFSQTELNGKCNQEIIEMLIQQKDIDWNKLKIYKQRGTCIIRSAHSSFLLMVNKLQQIHGLMTSIFHDS